MSGVGAVLARTRAQDRAALVGYLPVGFPDVQGSIDAMVAMVEAGVDIVEIGVPYTDPLMDGPVIAHAADVALQNGARLADVFTAVRAVADAGAPVQSPWSEPGALRSPLDGASRRTGNAMPRERHRRWGSRR